MAAKKKVDKQAELEKKVDKILGDQREILAKLLLWHGTDYYDDQDEIQAMFEDGEPEACEVDGLTEVEKETLKTFLFGEFKPVKITITVRSAADLKKLREETASSCLSDDLKEQVADALQED